MPTRKPAHWFDVTPGEFAQLIRYRANTGGFNKALLYLVGILLTPILLIGALLGYVRSYMRFMLPKDQPPVLAPLLPITRISMMVGAVLMVVVVYFGLQLLLYFTMQLNGGMFSIGFALAYVGFNLVLTLIAFAVFNRWRIGINNALVVSEKFGSARFARPDELDDYRNAQGFYIGGGLTFSDKGHMLTVAGTRGGKGTNLIIPNLLGAGGYKGSWVVIDPKGENLAVTGYYQHHAGQRLVWLNPWDAVPGYPVGQSYNPLDILRDTGNINLVDDAQVIAEMIVPIDKNDKERYFTDNARTIVAGLLLHLVTMERPAANPARLDAIEDGFGSSPITLVTLWKWVRLPKEKWQNLIIDMQTSENQVVVQSGLEIEKLAATGEKSWGIIIAVIMQCTDFIKSPAMQKALQSGFDPGELSDGKTTLYIVIPPDKLQSHARWLRLVVTTTMRAVVRKPNERVCFLLDEFSALGYLPEIETALSTYAGYNITVWPILQTLIQLKQHYHDSWETFVGNSTIRQFFSINDNFTADYVSRAIGETSHVLVKTSWFGVQDSEANSRALVTPDELRRASGQNIFGFFADKPVTLFPKWSYFDMPHIASRAKPNPYFKT